MRATKLDIGMMKDEGLTLNFMWTYTLDEGLESWYQFQARSVKRYILDQVKKGDDAFGWTYEDYNYEENPDITHDDFAEHVIALMEESMVDGDSAGASTIIFINGYDSNIVIPGHASTLSNVQLNDLLRGGCECK